MSGLSKKALKFLKNYESEYELAGAAAQVAKEIVTSGISNTGVMIHAITARAKSITSLRGKLRRKPYKQPDKQLTDIVGVRVITYYRDAVDEVAGKLRELFEVNEKHSGDKRLDLGQSDFGYRSVHLVVKPRKLTTRTEPEMYLQERWFEVQIRSLLEHAWAEIDHEIVYKSGTEFPEALLRQFASLAGTLELLDDQFLTLRNKKQELIKTYRDRYKARKDLATTFDTARLLGFLEATRPDGLSWRQAQDDGKPIATGLDVACVEALKAVGLSRPKALKKMMTSKRFRYAQSVFAAESGLAPAETSHLAIVVLAVLVKGPKTLKTHFPEIIFDNTIQKLVEKRAAPRRS